jgi:hypothetical protein
MADAAGTEPHGHFAALGRVDGNVLDEHGLVVLAADDGPGLARHAEFPRTMSLRRV